MNFLSMPSVNRVTLLQALTRRGFSVYVIVSSLCLWVISSFQRSQQIQWLRDDYALTPGHFQTFYLVLAVVFVPVLMLEPWLRRQMRRPGPALLAFVLALVVACGAVLLLWPDQPQRLFRTPNLLLYAIVHAAVTAAFPAWFALRLHLTGRRTMLAATLGVLTVLLLVNLLSVGRFARFDDIYDEAYLASGGTHYALSGGISPSFTGSAYGDPDPALARYYVLMGLWLRLLGSTDLAALRSFSMLAGLLAAGVTALALSRQRFNRLQVIVGLCVLFGLSTFVRTSHNVRMDIGLAVCAAAAMLFALEAFTAQRRKPLYFFLTGLSLYIGMESVPTVTLLFGIALGTGVIVASVDARQRHMDWRSVAAYTAGAAVACLVYLVLHYAPDIKANLDTMRDFSRVYVDMESVVAGQLERLFNFIRMSATLSPVEPLLVVGLLGLLLWQGRLADRVLVLVVLLTLSLIVIVIGGSYGYLVILAPFVAYAAARAMSFGRVAPLLALFLLPVMVTAPLHDMLATSTRDANSRQLAILAPVVAAVPDGLTVVGPDLLWFVLHDRVDYVGWSGLNIYRGRRRIEKNAALASLDVDLLICDDQQPRDCMNYLPAVEPVVVETDTARYLMYFAADAAR